MTILIYLFSQIKSAFALLLIIILFLKRDFFFFYL